MGSQGLQLGKGGLMTVPSSGPALLLATTLLFSPLLAADDPKYYNEKSNSEKLMPFVPLHAEQGLTRGDGSHGPPEEAGCPSHRATLGRRLIKNVSMMILNTLTVTLSH